MKKIDQCVKRIGAAVVLSGCLLLIDYGEENGAEAVELDKNKPTDITVWHYYNDVQEAALARIVLEFDDTMGEEQSICVKGHSKSNVTELETAVLVTSRKEVSSDATPNLLSSYADMAYELEKEGALADLAPYFTIEEQAEYLGSCMEEGRIGLNGELRIFPIAKSTEVLMLNKAVWGELAVGTGVTRDNLKAVKGIAGTVALYFDWMDAKTPDIPNDDKASYGRDAMANLFIVGSMQHDVELFHVEDGKVTLNVDRDVFYEIWQNYYVPYVKGYFGVYGRLRSDNLEIGELAAHTDSIASTGYFSDRMGIGDKTTPIKYLIVPTPVFGGAGPYIIQQGASMVAAKGAKEQEYASAVFLKWFTEVERNTEFDYTSGYIPVKKEANNKEMLDTVIQGKNLEMSTREYDTLLITYDMVATSNLYTNKTFNDGAKARKMLEYGLSDKAAVDREQVLQLLEEGKALEEAVGNFITEDASSVWFEGIKRELGSSVVLP